MLRLLIGKAGAGKTAAIINEISAIWPLRMAAP